MLPPVTANDSNHSVENLGAADPASESSERSRRGVWKRPSFTSLIPWILFATVFVLHVLSPNVMIADSLRAVPTAQSILVDHDLSLKNNLPIWSAGSDYAIQTVGSKELPFFPWGGSLFAVPFLILAAVWAKLTGGSTVPQYLNTFPNTWPFELVSMCFVVALTTVVIYHIARLSLSSLSARRRTQAATATALMFAFGTAAWSTADRSLWQHGPSMLFLSTTLLAALIIQSRSAPHMWRAPVGLGASAAAAYAMRPTNSLAIIGIGAWLLIRHPRSVLWGITGGIPVAILFFGVNRWQYGQFLPTYYEPTSLGASTGGRVPDFWVAIAGNLVSPARGILIFSPILALAILSPMILVRQHKLRSLQIAVGTIVIAHLVTISTFAQWWGGYTYGPRLMSDMVPFLVFLSLPVVEWLWSLDRARARRPATALAVTAILLAGAASVAINAEGALFRDTWCWNNDPPIDSNTNRLWDWQHGQFTAGFRSLRHYSWSEETQRASAITSGCPN
jgi:hypothetical protein